MIQCTVPSCKSIHFITTGMALEQAYWNERQAAGSWTGGFIYATGSPPPRKSTVAYFTPIHLFALWSYHANLAHGSTSHRVRDVELEEKDTEGGDKDKVQLADLTDRVIVWLTWLLMQTYHFYHYIIHPNVCCCDIYQHACYMCVTLLIGYHAFLFHGWDYGMAAMLKNCRHLEFVSDTRTFLKRVRSICRNPVLCIKIWKTPLRLVSCLLDYCSLCFI